jgi:hypothetical protein
VTYGLDPSTYRFSVDQYHRMIQADILGEDDPVELLEGYLVLKTSRNPAHDGTLGLIEHILRPHLPAGWLTRVRTAITLSESEPEPDVAIVRGGPRTYLTRHPGPGDVGLVIEVANTSLQRDLDDKTRLYARAGLPAYWVGRGVRPAVRPGAAAGLRRPPHRPPARRPDPDPRRHRRHPAGRRPAALSAGRPLPPPRRTCTVRTLSPSLPWTGSTRLGCRGVDSARGATLPVGARRARPAADRRPKGPP